MMAQLLDCIMFIIKAYLHTLRLTVDGDVICEADISVRIRHQTLIQSAIR